MAKAWRGEELDYSQAVCAVVYNSFTMSNYPHIDRYHEELQRLKDFGGSDNERSIRRAFENCLDSDKPAPNNSLSDGVVWP